MRVRMIVLTGLAAGILVGGLQARSGPYAKIGEIPIGGATSFDYLNVDAAARRLYVSHGTEMVVIDIDKNVVVGRIADTPGVHGIALAPDLNRGFTSNGRENQVSIVDLKTLATIAKVAAGTNPDAIAYEPKKKEVYAFNAAGSATVIDAAHGTVTATIPLDGKPETGQADPALDRMFVNIESGNQGSTVAAIDINTHAVVAHWPVAPAEGPTGLAIDVATHRLFSGGDQAVVMMDARTGKIVASAPICNGTDATWFDPGTKLVFSSCGDGKMTINKEDGDALTPVQTLTTDYRSRTMTLDPRTHNLYVVTYKTQPADPNAPATGRGGRGGGAAVPDSFHVVVFGVFGASGLK